MRRTRLSLPTATWYHKAASYLTDKPHVRTTIQLPSCQKSAVPPLNLSQPPIRTTPDLRLRETLQPRCSTLQNLALCRNLRRRHNILRLNGEVPRQRSPSETALQEHNVLLNTLLNSCGPT